MTTFSFASHQASIADSADLPNPEMASTSISCELNTGIKLPRPLPSVIDSGRISFGASCRMPLQK